MTYEKQNLLHKHSSDAKIKDKNRPHKYTKDTINSYKYTKDKISRKDARKEFDTEAHENVDYFKRMDINHKDNKLFQ